MEPLPPLRIGFFLDGYTLRKVNEYYKVYHRFHSKLDFRGLKSWVQLQALRYFDGGVCRDLELECHYYHPFTNPHIHKHDGAIRFEHELESAGYHVHFNRVVPGDTGVSPNMSLMEDALLFAVYRKLDGVVLFSTQGQFAPLPDRLRMMGVPTLLLGWDLVYPKAKVMVHWKTDSCLRETCAHYVAMEKEVDKSPNSDKGPRGFFFQCERPFSRGQGTKWQKN